MNRDSVNLKQNLSSSGYNHSEQNSSTEEETTLKFKQKSLFSMVKKTGQKDFIDTGVCEECSYIVALKLNEAEQNIINKDKFIELLKEQLELLKDRNIKSINEAQEYYYKFSVASQEIINLKHGCAKYDDELKKLRSERSHLTEFEQIVSTYKDEAERWKKQYEELVLKINKEIDKSKEEGTDENFSVPAKTSSDEEKWRSIIQDEVSTAVNMLKENSQVVISSLEKQNKKLETMTEKLQRDLDTATHRENLLQKDVHSLKKKLDDYKTQIKKLIDQNKHYEDNIQILSKNNATLAADFQRIDALYSDLQRNFEENMDAIESDFKKSTEISEDFNIVKEEYRALTKSLSGLLEEIVKAKENALTKNEELRQQVAEMGPSSNMKQFINQITLSLEKIGQPYEHKPEGLMDVSEPVAELSSSIADVQKINKLNTEIELQILEVKTNKKIASLQDENKRLKEDMLQKYDCLLTQIKESGEDIDEVSSELRHKKEIIQNQCYQICSLNDLIQEEKQRNDLLETELAHLKYEIQKEKTLNMQLSIQNEELKSQLDNSAKTEKSLEEEGISMKTSLHEIEHINKDLNIQLREAILTINEMETKMAENQIRMEDLEKANQDLQKVVENLKAETVEEMRREYEEKIQIFIEENANKEHKLDEERASVTSLKKHIDSLTFFHENEKKAGNARLQELEIENKTLKKHLELEIEKLTNMNMLQQEKIETIEEENAQLHKNISELHREMNILIDKLQTSDILQDPQIYVEALDTVSKENIEMKTAVNVLRDILGIKLGENDSSDKEKSVSSGLNDDSVKSSSLPNLENYENKETAISDKFLDYVKKSTSLSNMVQNSETLHTKIEDEVENPEQYIEKLHLEITSVLTKMNKNPNKLIPAIESSPEVYAEKYKQVIKNLQRQVKELQEEGTSYKKETDHTNMEEELIKLRKELCKQKIERIQETEIGKIKKEAEMFTLHQELKAQYLESKQKLLLDLARVQNALQEKHEEEMRIKIRCDELVKEVTAHQEARKKKMQEISLLADQPLPPLPSDVQKIVICNVTDSSQQNTPQSSQYPEIPVKPNVLVINARSKLNSLEKHRLTQESVPEASSDDELKNKYLLQ